ncbi:MAG: glycosyltransferase family 2 protein, partial [Treponema sp.]|nr:glycosyltransferase family 2 protein [Treponema sp.]
MNDMMPPLISICTPIYNTETYLEECVESLFTAKMADKCEFIFVDDCSTDSSPRILENLCKKYASLNTKIIRHEKNSGVAVARNTALAAATGAFIIHIDSDDSVQDDFLEKLYATAVETGADLVVCNNWRDFDSGFTSVQLVKLLLTHEMLPTLWCRIARRSLFTDNNIVWKEGINVGEDPIVSVKLHYFSKKTVFLRDMLYKYRSNIGFVTRIKKLSELQQKKREFSEIEDFARAHNFADEISEVLELRRAEIRYDFLKFSHPLSFKKYEFLGDVRLKILLEKRADFNKSSAKTLIKFVDKNQFAIANMMYAIYRLLRAVRNHE